MRLEISARYFWNTLSIRPRRYTGGELLVSIEPVKSDGTAEGRSIEFPKGSTLIITVSGLRPSKDVWSIGFNAKPNPTIATHAFTVGEGLIHPLKVAKQVSVEAILIEGSDMSKELCTSKATGVVLVPKIRRACYWIDRIWILVAIGISMIVAVVAAITPAGEAGLAQPGVSWIDGQSPLVQLAYVIVALTIVAAIIERVLEAAIAARRKPIRLELEILVEDAERAWKVDRKNVSRRSGLLNAELELASFRNETRVRTLAVGLALGSCFGAAVNLPLTEAAFGDGSGLFRLIEVLVVGILIAGGAEPLHDVLKAFRAGVKNLAGIGSTKLR